MNRNFVDLISILLWELNQFKERIENMISLTDCEVNLVILVHRLCNIVPFYLTRLKLT